MRKSQASNFLPAKKKKARPAFPGSPERAALKKCQSNRTNPALYGARIRRCTDSGNPRSPGILFACTPHRQPAFEGKASIYKKGPNLEKEKRARFNRCAYGAQNYAVMSATTPEPTVRPPSRIAKRRPSSIAIGAISLTLMVTLSPGITISVPSGRITSPVTSVVRK